MSPAAFGLSSAEAPPAAYPNPDRKGEARHAISRRPIAQAVAALAFAWLALACDSREPSRNQAPAVGRETSGSTNGDATPRPTLLHPEAKSWSLEEAAARLPDEKLRLSAAVRLVQLADVRPMCVPDTLTDDLLARLRIVPLLEGLWALGLPDPQTDGALAAVVLLRGDGSVELPSPGLGEELLVLHVAKDPDVFPHLLLGPDRIYLVRQTLDLAVTLRTPGGTRFALREQGGYNYVGLVLPRTGQATEVARYVWDPYEMVFQGPAMDKLPDPPGGKFRVDLRNSPRLVPVGGEIPDPDPIEQDRPRDERLPA